MKTDKIYLGIKGQVVCLEKETGREVWRANTRWSNLVNVVVDGDAVLAYANGHLFCMDAETGAPRWKNELSGLGHGYCIIATANSQATTAVAAAQQIQAQQAAAIAASSAAAAAAASSS